MPSVVLSGCDGSGKTTVARILASYLSKRGSTGMYWFRGSHLLASILLRLLSRFKTFRGPCNPYYQVCIPNRLKRLWAHIEFWSATPYIILRLLLAKLHAYTVYDRGVIDFIAWVTTTLSYPSFIESIYGKFLLRLALQENTVYLYADIGALTKRSDTPPEFTYREYAIYTILARYTAKCVVDTTKSKPVEAVVQTLKCVNIV